MQDRLPIVPSGPFLPGEGALCYGSQQPKAGRRRGGNSSPTLTPSPLSPVSEAEPHSISLPTGLFSPRPT